MEQEAEIILEVEPVLETEPEEVETAINSEPEILVEADGELEEGVPEVVYAAVPADKYKNKDV